MRNLTYFSQLRGLSLIVIHSPVTIYCHSIAFFVLVSAKNIAVLYNNRSAMYFKLDQFDESLLDINVVLAMDPKVFHI